MVHAALIPVEHFLGDELLWWCALWMGQVLGRLSELQATIDASNRHRDNLLNTVSYQIEAWTNLVRMPLDSCCTLFQQHIKSASSHRCLVFVPPDRTRSSVTNVPLQVVMSDNSLL